MSNITTIISTGCRRLGVPPVYINIGLISTLRVPPNTEIKLNGAVRLKAKNTDIAGLQILLFGKKCSIIAGTNLFQIL